MLDYFIDQAEDEAHGELNFVACYATPADAVRRLRRLVRATLLRVRGLAGAARHRFVLGEDLSQYKFYAGNRPAFLAIAPWVTPDWPRATLRGTGAALAPVSGSPLEYDAVETATVAATPARRSRAIGSG